jgi:Uma2 family endonuclease
MTAVPNLPLRPLTLHDVTALAEADGQHRFELTEGNLIVMPPGTWRHQRISKQLVIWLDRHFGDRANLTAGVKTSDDDLNGRIPDLVVTKGDLPSDADVWLPAASVLLAVEIVSPGSERTDRWLKPLEYADAGIPHFWRVEPDDTVLRFRLVDGVYTEVGKDPLDALLAGGVPDLG